MNDEQEALAGLALTVFRLNGQFLSLAEEIARPVGLTAAWWQVLGAVLNTPLTVSGIARTMGITRQSVLRIADRLVEDGLAEYRSNPAHKTARLLAPTDEGYDAVRRLDAPHADAAALLAAQLPLDELRATLEALRGLSVALDAVEQSG